MTRAEQRARRERVLELARTTTLRTSEIAAQVGLSVSSAWKFLRAEGLETRRGGAGRPCARTPAVLARRERAAAMRAAGKTWAEIGAALGVSRQRALQIAQDAERDRRR